jgi:hypothetical protein
MSAAEKWAPLPELVEYFEVSNLGRVRSKSRHVEYTHWTGQRLKRLKQARVLATQVSNAGYELVHLGWESCRSVHTVHSLVLATFVGPRPEGHDVCHNNGNRLDNRLSNLRYDTRINNHVDRIAHGTIYDGATGAKLTRPQVLSIRSSKAGQTELAAEFKVSVRTIRRIRSGKAWKYV